MEGDDPERKTASSSPGSGAKLGGGSKSGLNNVPMPPVKKKEKLPSSQLSNQEKELAALAHSAATSAKAGGKSGGGGKAKEQHASAARKNNIENVEKGAKAGGNNNAVEAGGKKTTKGGTKLTLAEKAEVEKQNLISRIRALENQQNASKKAKSCQVQKTKKMLKKEVETESKKDVKKDVKKEVRNEGWIRKPCGRVPKDSDGIPMEWDHYKALWLPVTTRTIPHASSDPRTTATIVTSSLTPETVVTTNKRSEASRKEQKQSNVTGVSNTQVSTSIASGGSLGPRGSPSPASTGKLGKEAALTPRTPAEEKDLQEAADLEMALRLQASISRRGERLISPLTSLQPGFPAKEAGSEGRSKIDEGSGRQGVGKKCTGDVVPMGVFRCEWCARACNSKRGYTRHSDVCKLNPQTRHAHSAEEQGAQCPNCNRMFKSLASMHGHRTFCKSDSPLPLGLSKTDANYQKKSGGGSSPKGQTWKQSGLKRRHVAVSASEEEDETVAMDAKVDKVIEVESVAAVETLSLESEKKSRVETLSLESEKKSSVETLSLESEKKSSVETLSLESEKKSMSTVECAYQIYPNKIVGLYVNDSVRNEANAHLERSDDRSVAFSTGYKGVTWSGRYPERPFLTKEGSWSQYFVTPLDAANARYAYMAGWPMAGTQLQEKTEATVVPSNLNTVNALTQSEKLSQSSKSGVQTHVDCVSAIHTSLTVPKKRKGERSLNADPVQAAGCLACRSGRHVKHTCGITRWTVQWSLGAGKAIANMKGNKKDVAKATEQKRSGTDCGKRKRVAVADTTDTLSDGCSGLTQA